MLNRLLLSGSTLMLLAVTVPAAAQRSTSDRDLFNRQNSVGLSTEDRNRFDELKEREAKDVAAEMDLRQKLLRLPPLPDERNVLLGSWRVNDADQGAGVAALGQIMGTGGTDATLRELWATLESNPQKLLCVPMFGNGINFASSTYSIRSLDGSVYGGPVDYRSTRKQVIVALPGNWKDMSFEITSPDRIVGPHGCALVRVGASAAGSAANAPTAAARSTVSRETATVPQAAPVAPAFQVKYNYQYKCGNERVEVFYCRNDNGQPVPEIDNFCNVEYPDRPRRMADIAVFASVRKSDLAKQLASCTGPAASTK